jgi:hypothetical protein
LGKPLSLTSNRRSGKDVREKGTRWWKEERGEECWYKRYDFMLGNKVADL